MSFSGQLTVSLLAQMTGALDIERLTTNVDKSWSIQLGDGDGLNLAQRIWSDTRQLASGASEMLDLSGNALKDAFGANVTLSKAKILLIAANPANTTVLTVGNVANGLVAPFIDADNGVIVPPGGIFVSATPDANGYGLVAGTRDLLKIANGGAGQGGGTGEATYDIVVIGA